jgi:hypothetical protein
MKLESIYKYVAFTRPIKHDSQPTVIHDRKALIYKLTSADQNKQYKLKHKFCHYT